MRALRTAWRWLTNSIWFETVLLIGFILGATYNTVILLFFEDELKALLLTVAP